MKPPWREAIRAIGLGDPGELDKLDRDRLRDLLLPRLLGSRSLGGARVQLRIERFLAEDPPMEPRARSLALGICQHALLLRLPRHDEATLAGWLAEPASAPRSARANLRKILDLQAKRDRLHDAWDGYAAEVTAERPAAPAGGADGWTGLAVRTGRATGTAWLAPETPDAEIPVDAEIRVFRRATPETTRFFAGARGIVFIEGSVLSHACSVARERGIPAITGVGARFRDELARHARAKLELEVSSGGVSRVRIRAPERP